MIKKRKSLVCTFGRLLVGITIHKKEKNVTPRCPPVTSLWWQGDHKTTQKTKVVFFSTNTNSFLIKLGSYIISAKNNLNFDFNFCVFLQWRRWQNRDIKTKVLFCFLKFNYIQSMQNLVVLPLTGSDPLQARTLKNKPNAFRVRVKVCFKYMN